jgi:hypothetical protein
MLVAMTGKRASFLKRVLSTTPAEEVFKCIQLLESILWRFHVAAAVAGRARPREQTHDFRRPGQGWETEQGASS